MEVRDVWERFGETIGSVDIMVTEDGDLMVKWLSFPPVMYNAGGGWHLERLDIILRFFSGDWASGFRTHAGRSNFLSHAF